MGHNTCLVIQRVRWHINLEEFVLETFVAGLGFSMSEGDFHRHKQIGIRSRSKFINCNY